MKRNPIHAFTLIEIMIVVAIIGMLVAIVVPNLKKSIETARQQACALNRRNIDGAKVQWAAEHKQATTAVPPDDELFGKTGYIEHKPGCPAGGAYAINAVDEKCTCSVPRHEDEL